MTPGNFALPDNLTIRAARSEDQGFMASLYRTTRDDLRRLDADREFVESLIDMQQQAQVVGYGEQFPNAHYFIVERLGERIGRIVVDFGQSEVRLVDIAFLPGARGQGYGTQVIRALQRAATQVHTPLALVVHRDDPRARRLYGALGFVVAETHPMADKMVWTPVLNMS